MLVFGVVSKSALEGIWDGFWLDFERFGKGFGRVLGGILKDSGLFWATLGYFGVFWVIGMFFDDLGRLLLGAACLFACFCMLLLAFACFWLLVLTIAYFLRGFAPWSVELILNLNSSWLHCLVWLTFACFCLLLGLGECWEAFWSGFRGSDVCRCCLLLAAP